ncbi:MAG: archaeoflavoprotein AfpA [Candidatus Hermodarchaeota archaeon]
MVWGITGAGDLLPEIFEVMSEIAKIKDLEITAVVSKAAQKVLKWYKFWDKLEPMVHRVLVEKDANTPFIIGPAQTGRYNCLLIAPASANTTAKIVYGIADTLITNLVAQTNKTDLEIIILPVDQRNETKTTVLPDGKKLELKMREIDVQNTVKLRKMKGITVLAEPGDIKTIIYRNFSQ